MKIKLIEKQDCSMIVETLVSAFMDDPLYVYLIPEENHRKVFLKTFMQFRLKYGMKNGVVEVTEDLKGVGIWIKPNKEMHLIHFMLMGGMNAVLNLESDARKRIMQFTQFESAFKKEFVTQPYWYLSPIAVDQAYQGQGYGRVLLQSRLKAIGGSKAFCFLETQSEQNRRIYEKYGFECVGITQVPNTTIPHYCMIKKD